MNLNMDKKHSILSYQMGAAQDGKIQYTFNKLYHIFDHILFKPVDSVYSCFVFLKIVFHLISIHKFKPCSFLSVILQTV